MASDEENKRDVLLGLYAHTSRIYNGSVNAAIAVIFGWLAFFGFSMAINQALFTFYLKIILIGVGLIMFTFGLYFYFRIWVHGRYLTAMMQDLGLGEYVVTMPRFRLLTRLNWRPPDQPSKWTLGEWIGIIFIILSFMVPLIILASRGVAT